mmetsp:Transcript_17035/g.38345  ORF Transcript_17035/g.38345 Transcript_17035/m.38345 type:complete len:114 (-) Transcript_17035:832-1173(-)
MQLGPEREKEAETKNNDRCIEKGEEEGKKDNRIIVPHPHSPIIQKNSTENNQRDGTKSYYLDPSVIKEHEHRRWNINYMDRIFFCSHSRSSDYLFIFAGHFQCLHGSTLNDEK